MDNIILFLFMGGPRGMSPFPVWLRGASPFPKQMGAPYQDSVGLKQAHVSRKYKETSWVKNLISVRFL